MTCDDDLTDHPRDCRCAPCRVESRRDAEDRALYVGLAIAALYSVGEFLVFVGLVTPPAERGIPWITLIFFVGCVLPKTIGRVTTGKVWVILANGVAGWFTRKEKS